MRYTDRYLQDNMNMIFAVEIKNINLKFENFRCPLRGLKKSLYFCLETVQRELKQHYPLLSGKRNDLNLYAGVIQHTHSPFIRQQWI